MEEYLLWHYTIAPPTLILIWRNLLLFPIYYFSLPLHIATLFSPWKRQFSKSDTPGFHPGDFFRDISFNGTSRIVGALMRSAMILAGLGFSVCTAIVGGIGVCSWFLLPGIGHSWYRRLEQRKRLTVPFLLENTMNDLPKLAVRLAVHPQAVWMWQRLAIAPQTVMQVANQPPGMDHASSWKIFERYLRDTAKSQRDWTISDVLIACIAAYLPFKTFFQQHTVSITDIAHVCAWHEATHPVQESSLLFNLTKIKQLPGIGGDWAYGYTTQFDKFARDMTRSFWTYQS